MLNKILPIPSSLIVSSKNSSGSDKFVGAKSNDEISNCKLRPLIYALTGTFLGPRWRRLKPILSWVCSKRLESRNSDSLLIKSRTGLTLSSLRAWSPRKTNASLDPLKVRSTSCQINRIWLEGMRRTLNI